MAEHKSAWEAYAPPGSKRRKVLDYFGVSTSSWLSRAGASASTSEQDGSQQGPKPAHRTRDTTQPLSNYFSPSRKADVGHAGERARCELGDIAEDSSGTVQWQEQSTRLSAEQKQSLWVTSRYIPGGGAVSTAQSGDNLEDAEPEAEDHVADDEEAPQKKKDKIQFMARRNARSAQSTMGSVLKRKVFVSTNRATALKSMFENVKTEAAQPDVEDSLARLDIDTAKPQLNLIRVLVIGFERDDARVEELRASLGPGYLLKEETFIERDWVTMMKTARSTYTVDQSPGSEGTNGAVVSDASSEALVGDEAQVKNPPEGNNKKKKESSAEKKKRQPQLVVVRFPDAEIAEFKACTVATHFMANRIVLPFVDADHLPEEQQAQLKAALEDLMQGTWPVLCTMDSVCEFSKKEAPMLLRLNRCIREDVYEKIHHYGKVNYLWHGAKRVPVAFVPFGVTAVNFLGLSKLVANILRDTGMFQDPETKKAGIAQAALSYGKVFVLDNLGDLYQLTAAGTVVAGLSEALMAGGLLAAIETLDAVDFALLGSASLVTGAVAAVGAALSRPDMVESLASLIATLQTLWLVFPQIRRNDSSADAADTGAAADDDMDKAGNHAKLYAMCSMRPERLASDAGQPQAATPADPGSLQAAMYTEELDDAEMHDALRLMLGEEEAAQVLPALRPRTNQTSGAEDEGLPPQ